MSFHSTRFQSPARRTALLKLHMIVALLIVLSASRAWAQPPSLSQRVLTSEDPAAFRAEIDAYQEHYVQQLFGADASAVSQSRRQLTDPLKPDASVSFKVLYADTLALRLQRRLSGAAMLNQLNAAIVTERMATIAQSPRLAPLIRLLMDDDDAAVALWGAKAAYPVFPELARDLPARERDNLIASLVAAAKRFPENGPLAEEAYRTLSMRLTGSNPPPAQVLEAGAPAVVPAVQNLIEFRISQYGPSRAAAAPLAELPGLVVLTNNVVWPAQTPEHKANTARVMRDLMLQAMATANNLPQGSEERVPIVELIRRIGSAYEAISSPAQLGGTPQFPELNRAANKLKNISTRSSPAVLAQAVGEVRDGLGKAFPNLPQPGQPTNSSAAGSNARN